MRARRPVEMVGLPLRALPTPTSRTLTPQAERRSEAVASERAREVSIAGVLVELCECRGAAPRPVAANGRSERAKRVSKPIGGVTDTGPERSLCHPQDQLPMKKRNRLTRDNCKLCVVNPAARTLSLKIKGPRKI